MRRLTTLLLLSPALLLGLLQGAAGAPASRAQPARPAPVQKKTPVPAPSPEVIRERLTVRINEERARAGVPPLAPSEPLQKVAQQRAEEIAARGALSDERESLTLFGVMQTRMAKAGYKAHGWTESVTVTAGEADEVVAYWRTDPSYGQAMGRDYQDVGIGLATFQGVPLYTFVFAWPRAEFYHRQTEALADAARVRAAMLEQVNAERRAAGAEPLTADPRLDAAAQKHAEDMLARVFYDHISPEGTTPRQRVQAAGYLADTVGENIAAGHFTVDTVVDAWLHSSGHRRNILDPRFRHLGVGIAVGSYEHRYQVLWVQDFGRPASP